jgi:predicted transposase YdaD
MPKKRPSSKPFDTTFKHLIELRPRDIVVFLGVPDVQSMELIDAELSTIVAAADKVLRVRTGAGEFLVHLEFQTGADVDLDSRLFGYNALLYRQHGLPVWTVLFVLTPKADNKRWTGTLEIKLPTGQTCHTFRYHVIRVWQLVSEQVLQSGLGLLPLAPLCGDAAENVASVVRQMSRRLDQEAKRAEKESIWAATYFLMGLRFDAALARQLIPRGEHMKESTTYMATLEEGAVAEARKILTRLGRVQFGVAPPQVVKQLEAIESIEELEELNERVLKTSSWDELLAPKSKRRRNGKKDGLR